MIVRYAPYDIDVPPMDLLHRICGTSIHLKLDQFPSKIMPEVVQCSIKRFRYTERRLTVMGDYLRVSVDVVDVGRAVENDVSEFGTEFAERFVHPRIPLPVVTA